MTEIINVIVVVLNDKIGLRRTLNSIFDQNISNQYYRIIVVDGFSHDGSFELANSMVGQTGHVFRSEPRGIYDAMNVGLAKVLHYPEHDGVLFLNAGDFFYSPRSLSILTTELKAHAHVVGLSAFLEISGRYQVSVPEIVFSKLNSPVFMWLPHQSYCATIGVYKEVGVMNNTFRVAGDVDWFIRAISKVGIPHHIPEIISVQVVGGASRRYAYLGYQERRKIASTAGIRVDRYSLTLLIRVYLSQKLGIRLPKFLRKKVQVAPGGADEVIRRYAEISNIPIIREFLPED